MRSFVIGGVGALFLVPLATEASLPPTWRVVGALLVLVAALPTRWAWPWLTAVGASLVYVGGAATPWSEVRAGCGLVGLAALLVIDRAPRRVIGLSLLGLVTATIGLALNVLGRSGWPAEALMVGRLGTGLVFGSGFALVAMQLREGTPQPLAFRCRLAATCLVAMTLFVGLSIAEDGLHALPRWRVPMRALQELDPVARTLEEADGRGYLEDLRASGFADAAYATVALATQANADPESLRRWCPKRERAGVLDERWRDAVELGRFICGALARWPEAAVVELEAATLCKPSALPPSLCSAGVLSSPWRGALLRLAADLLMDAGLVDQALQRYVAADAALDPFARRDAVRALLDRARRDQAVAVADVRDPLSRGWLELAGDPTDSWRAWNDSVDFAHIASPRRSGIVFIGAPGKLVTFVDPTLRRRVATSLAKYVLASGSAMPPPPGGQVPAEIRLWFRSRRGFQLNLVPAAGRTLAYGCDDPQRPERMIFVPLPESGCRGEWTEATLHPREVLSESLVRLEMMGEYSVARLVASPPEGSP